MEVYIYIYIYTHTHTYAHTHTNLHMFTCIQLIHFGWQFIISSLFKASTPLPFPHFKLIKFFLFHWKIEGMRREFSHAPNVKFSHLPEPAHLLCLFSHYSGFRVYMFYLCYLGPIPLTYSRTLLLQLSSSSPESSICSTLLDYAPHTR